MSTYVTSPSVSARTPEGHVTAHRNAHHQPGWLCQYEVRLDGARVGEVQNAGRSRWVFDAATLMKGTPGGAGTVDRPYRGTLERAACTVAYLSVPEQRMRTNARGVRIPSNYGIDGYGDNPLTCLGCGRVFDAYRLNGDLAPRVSDAWRRDSLNRMRAVRHADACKGPKA